MFIEGIGSFEEAERLSRVQPISKGKYHVQVTKAEIAQGEKGKYINYRLDLVGNPEYNGRVLFHMVSFAPKAVGLLVAWSKAVGMTNWEDYSSEEAYAEATVGKELDVEVGVYKVEEFNGKLKDIEITLEEAMEVDKPKNKVKKVVIPK